MASRDEAREYEARSNDGRIYDQTCRFSCHYEEQSDAAILKFEVWHPEAKYGNTKRNVRRETGHTVHSVSLYFATGWQIVPSKIAASGAKMRPPRNDKTDGFPGKQNGFQNKKFQICRGATPQRAPMGHSFTQAPACASLAAASFTRPQAALHFSAFHLRSVFHSAGGQISLRGQWAVYHCEARIKGLCFFAACIIIKGT